MNVYAKFLNNHISLLFLCIFLPGFASNTGAQFKFDKYEVSIGSEKRLSVLSGSFLSGQFADLAVLNLNNRGDRKIRIFSLEDGKWVQKLDSKLGPEVLYVD
ncbi:MAG: hypothetical protein HKN25_04855, partial [Pyrinomonadaceae bacterium]|nr:hypothetical protein [Pyrinomonadaceae bacterium]